jgi:hypothetical protein
MGTTDSSQHYDGVTRGVRDEATLYLCRQGPRWIVVLEAPSMRGAIRLEHMGSDPYDARFELLSKARRACPDAAITSRDGAVEGADYEWRLDVRGLEARVGDLGVALREALTVVPETHLRRTQRGRPGRVCRRELWPSNISRPRDF